MSSKIEAEIILNKMNSINPDCQHWLLLYDMPTDYETFSQLKLSEKIGWQAWWQSELEKGKELEWYNRINDSWHLKESGYIDLGILYRIKPQPTYAERQKKWIEENNIQVGSEVRVTRKADSYENGWNSSWIDEMDEFVGKRYTVKSIAKDTNEIGLHFAGRPDLDYFPYFVLEPVKTKMVPLDFSDYLDIERKWIIDTRTNEKCFIGNYETSYNKIVIYYQTDHHYVTFEDLQKHFTTIDGSRFEKEIEV